MQSSVFESEAARRGKLKTDTPGEFHFTSTMDVIDFVAGQLRGSQAKYKDLVKATDDIKSPTTISNLASGKTHYPRFSTIFGTAGALGLEVVLTRGRRS